MVKSILIFAALAASVAAIPSPRNAAHIAGFKRAGGCNADNLLRNFRDKRYSVAASSFCSIYIQSTTTTTLSLTKTTSETKTITPDVVVVTKTSVITETETETTLTTDYPTAGNTFVKRGEIPYPTWLAASYPPLRVSSACSCFVTPSPQATQVITTTASTQTNTETTTLPTVTNTDTTFTTETAQATTTQVIVGDSIYCGYNGCAAGPGFLTQQYEDAGVISKADCKTFCGETEDCTHYQWGDDATNNFSFCNVFSGSQDDSYEIGSSTDPTCPWLWYDLRCNV